MTNKRLPAKPARSPRSHTCRDRGQRMPRREKPQEHLHCFSCICNRSTLQLQITTIALLVFTWTKPKFILAGKKINTHLQHLQRHQEAQSFHQNGVPQVAACARIGVTLQQTLSVAGEAWSHNSLLGYNTICIYLIRGAAWCDRSATACLRSP